MAFDAKRFMKTKFSPRTAEVKLPDLVDWFDEGDEPVWVVRGLDAAELARAEEASNKKRNIKAVLELLDGLSVSDTIDQLKSSLGLDDETPSDTIKKMEHLVMGSISPVVSLDLAVKLAAVRPIEFLQLSHQIMSLTGKGQVAEKKQQPSGVIPA